MPSRNCNSSDSQMNNGKWGPCFIPFYSDRAKSYLYWKQSYEGYEVAIHKPPLWLESYECDTLFILSLIEQTFSVCLPGTKTEVEPWEF